MQPGSIPAAGPSILKIIQKKCTGDAARAPDRGGSADAAARLYPVEEATLGATANRWYKPGGAAKLQPMAGNGALKISF